MYQGKSDPVATRMRSCSPYVHIVVDKFQRLVLALSQYIVQLNPDCIDLCEHMWSKHCHKEKMPIGPYMVRTYCK